MERRFRASYTIVSDVIYQSVNDHLLQSSFILFQRHFYSDRCNTESLTIETQALGNLPFLFVSIFVFSNNCNTKASLFLFVTGLWNTIGRYLKIINNLHNF